MNNKSGQLLAGFRRLFTGELSAQPVAFTIISGLQIIVWEENSL